MSGNRASSGGLFIIKNNKNGGQIIPSQVIHAEEKKLETVQNDVALFCITTYEVEMMARTGGDYFSNSLSRRYKSGTRCTQRHLQKAAVKYSIKTSA